MTQTIGGLSFDFYVGNRTGHIWYGPHASGDWHDSGEWKEMVFIRDRMIAPGDVILECGAHHGCTTILLSKWAGVDGKVIAFEPLAENCRIFQKNMELNEIVNVQLVQMVVGSTGGKVLVSGRSNGKVENKNGRGTEVPVTCLDEFKQLEPTFLKIDVEGFELEVLKGAKRLLATRPKLAIEIHPKELKKFGAVPADVISLIDDRDYDMWIQRDASEDPVSFRRGEEIATRVHIFAVPR